MARIQSTRGGNSQAAGFAAGRGLLIVLFATAIGVLLLARAVDTNSGDVATGSASDGTVAAKPEDGGQDVAASSTVPPPTTASTIPPKKEPQDVVVLVANGRSVPGAAKANADALSVQNYNLLSPTDYPSPVTDTAVYFAAGYQADAIAVATALTIDVAKVVALPTTALPLDLKNAAVVVVLGTDGQGLLPS